MAWTIGSPVSVADVPRLETYVDVAVSEAGPSSVPHGGSRAPKRVVITPLNDVARGGEQAIQMTLVTSSLSGSAATSAVKFAMTSATSAAYTYRIYFTFGDFA